VGESEKGRRRQMGNGKVVLRQMGNVIKAPLRQEDGFQRRANLVAKEQREKEIILENNSIPDPSKNPYYDSSIKSASSRIIDESFKILEEFK
jgi:hypothetical protein